MQTLSEKSGNVEYQVEHLPRWHLFGPPLLVVTIYLAAIMEFEFGGLWFLLFFFFLFISGFVLMLYSISFVSQVFRRRWTTALVYLLAIVVLLGAFFLKEHLFRAIDLARLRIFESQYMRTIETAPRPPGSPKSASFAWGADTGFAGNNTFRRLVYDETGEVASPGGPYRLGLLVAKECRVHVTHLKGHFYKVVSSC